MRQARGRVLRPSAISSSVWVAVASACLLAGLGAVLGWTAVSDSWLAGSENATGRPPVSDHLGAIVATNVGACLLLYSGVATLGLTSLAGLGLVGAFVGASMRAVVTNLGLAGTVQHSGAYLVLELGGVVLAGAAGLLPLAEGTRAAFGEDQKTSGPVTAYAGALPRSLRLMAVAIVLIVTAATVEAL